VCVIGARVTVRDVSIPEIIALDYEATLNIIMPKRYTSLYSFDGLLKSRARLLLIVVEEFAGSILWIIMSMRIIRTLPDSLV